MKMRASLSRRPGGRRLAIWLALGTTAFLIIAALAANYTVGRVLRAKIAKIADARLHAPVSAKLGGGPAVIDAIEGRVPKVQIDASDASVCSLHGVDVSATLDNVTKHASRVSLASTHADVKIGTGTLTGVIDNKLPSATAGADPADGLLDIYAGPGGALNLQVQPKLTGDSVSFGVTGVQILGRPAPKPITQRIEQKVHIRKTLTGLPLDLRPVRLSVTSSGLTVRLDGGKWTGGTTARSPACR